MKSIKILLLLSIITILTSCEPVDGWCVDNYYVNGELISVEYECSNTNYNPIGN
jgi:hypothetical protein